MPTCSPDAGQIVSGLSLHSVAQWGLIYVLIKKSILLKFQGKSTFKYTNILSTIFVFKVLQKHTNYYNKTSYLSFFSAPIPTVRCFL